MRTKEDLYDEADRLRNSGNNEEAVAKLLELTAQEPDYALAHSALAVLYTRLKRRTKRSATRSACANSIRTMRLASRL